MEGKSKVGGEEWEGRLERMGSEKCKQCQCIQCAANRKSSNETGRDGGGPESLFKHIIARYFIFASMGYAPEDVASGLHARTDGRAYAFPQTS